MKLADLAAKPKLEQIVLDTPTILELYGESLEFYMFDRQDISVFLRLSQMKDDRLEIFNLLKEVILDEHGKPVLSDGEMLPLEVMAAVIEGVVQKLGNLKPQTTTTKALNSQAG
jgi:hypothetical protein